MKRATSSCLHFVAWALFCLSVSAQPEETRLNLPFNIGGGGFDTGIAVANAGDTSGSIELTLSQTLNDGSVQTFVLQNAGKKSLCPQGRFGGV